jgi:hypothetical protein
MIPPDDELLLAMFILKGGAWKEQSTDAHNSGQQRQFAGRV